MRSVCSVLNWKNKQMEKVFCAVGNCAITQLLEKHFILPFGPLWASSQIEEALVVLVVSSHQHQHLCNKVPDVICINNPRMQIADCYTYKLIYEQMVNKRILQEIMISPTRHNTWILSKQIFLYYSPVDNKVYTVRFGINGCLGEAKLVSWPQFITKEAACVYDLISCLETCFCCISSCIHCLQKNA